MRQAGWFRFLILFAATPLLAWLALPGQFSFWPLLFVCLVPFISAVTAARTPVSPFVYGLASGILFYLLQIYWIIPVLTEFGGLPWILALLALLLLVFYMSLYLALFGVGLAMLARGGGFWGYLVGAPALWVGLDWVRAWLFSGFPWMDLGYGLWQVPFFLQGADLVGHHGYTFTLILTNVVIALFLTRQFSVTQRYGGGMALVLLLCASIGYATLRWQEVNQQVMDAPSVEIGIVQGNIEQGQKWSESARERTVKKYIGLSRSLLETATPSLFVWPETALPFYPHRHPLSISLQELASESGSPIITGAPWYTAEQKSTTMLISYYNSALMITGSGLAENRYDKSHLVPFGEYVPLRKYLPFISPLVEAAGNFTPGVVGSPLVAGEIRAGILICFESIFPDIGRQWVKNGANVLVNLTNDAWYGKSSAPHQSWAMTIFRAVETRRSLVRAANTGISGVIDPLGRIREESGLFVDWAGVAEVPLLDTDSFFVRWGYLFGPLCAATGALAWLLGLIGARRKTGLVL